MFINFLQVYLPIVIYILLIAILIVGIMIGCRLIRTLDKIDQVVDDVSDKVASLNGIFSVIDFTTDKLVGISDKLIDGATSLFSKIFKSDKKEKITKGK